MNQQHSAAASEVVLTVWAIAPCFSQLWGVGRGVALLGRTFDWLHRTDARELTPWGQMT